ncbi:hypothetical protein [uncultured Kingella sp.]|uniref:hypothetical protein n=1 Tax=uncultured Kingella sp. TaxID=159270 RepID=UPI002598CB04|nr:hypothetical protein [uncultured Kingella sp.]
MSGKVEWPAEARRMEHDALASEVRVLDIMNVCNLALAGLPALVDLIRQDAPRKSLPQMCTSANRLLLAAWAAAKDEPELLDVVEQTMRQFEIAAAFAESEISTKH